MIEFALVAVAGAIGYGAIRIAEALTTRRRDAQVLDLLAILGPACERAHADPRALVAWCSVAAAARRAFPVAFAILEHGSDTRFPFSPADLEAAHARWSTEWLDWERRQDAEHRARREAIEAELERATDETASPLRARLDALEREKLEQYQRRYEEYVRVSRALKELAEAPVEPDPLS